MFQINSKMQLVAALATPTFPQNFIQIRSYVFESYRQTDRGKT